MMTENEKEIHRLSEKPSYQGASLRLRLRKARALVENTKHTETKYRLLYLDAMESTECAVAGLAQLLAVKELNEKKEREKGLPCKTCGGTLESGHQRLCETLYREKKSRRKRKSI